MGVGDSGCMYGEREGVRGMYDAMEDGEMD